MVAAYIQQEERLCLMYTEVLIASLSLCASAMLQLGGWSISHNKMQRNLSWKGRRIHDTTFIWGLCNETDVELVAVHGGAGWRGELR